MQLRSKQTKLKFRRGGMLIELAVSTIVLISLLSIATTLCFQVSLVWRDINQHRVAVAELSNQLDQLTRMDPQQARETLKSMIPSELSKHTLRDPQLSGKLIETTLGQQINLQLNWNRRHPGKPVKLVGWISSDNSSAPSETD